MKEKGYLQIYTGDGKGKTTAAAGLCARALGAGMRVFFAQFIKSGKSPEFAALSLAGDAFLHRAFGRGKFFTRGAVVEDEDREAAAAGLAECAAALSSGKFDVVVMDEAPHAVRAGLFSLEALLDTVRQRAPETELVVTGRNAQPELLEAADLVTEMREIKHYYKKGVKARRGIEL